MARIRPPFFLRISSQEQQLCTRTKRPKVAKESQQKTKNPKKKNFSMLSRVPQQHRSALTKYREKILGTIRLYSMSTDYAVYCTFDGSIQQLTNAANNGTICYNSKEFLQNLLSRIQISWGFPVNLWCRVRQFGCYIVISFKLSGNCFFLLRRILGKIMEGGAWPSLATAFNIYI